MAKRTIHQLIDDKDGGEATTSITFAVDGTEYEIDLNDANAEKFHEALSTWTDVARKVSKPGTKTGAGSRGGQRNDLGVIREWAKAQGMKVSDRGRVAQHIVVAYDAAH